MEGIILGGRYELIQKIGEGGMAIVYKARCRILDRIVAVKILKEEYSSDANFVEKFRTEALSVARISHPNIVNIYDVGQEDETYYIVMEYIDGKTLKELIYNQAPLPVDKAVDIAIMICDAIHHAHEKGIIHRDIKPHNIIITTDGMVKVADFGIARAISNATITYGKNIVGSVHYISPEQAKGEPIDRTTDIYSVGCVLYEMLTGKMPFEADSPITVALKHIHDDPVPARSINPDIPAAIEGIIQKAMEKLPAQRFRTAQEMRNALLNGHTSGLGQTDYASRYRHEQTIVLPPLDGERSEKDLKKKKKIRPFGIAIIVIAIIGLLSGVVFVMGDGLFGKEVAVPDIVGMTTKEANEALQEKGLVMKVIGEEYSADAEPDTVLSQDPGKGRKVKEGREIKVIISKGSELVEVPNIRGIDLSDAKEQLEDAGLKLGTQDPIYDDKYDEGVVISQDPSPNDKVKSGSRVNVTVSKGKQPAKIQMPDLLGISLDQAKKVLEANKLELGGVNQAESSKYYSGQVSSQDIAAGVMVDEGSKVNLVVSTGPGPTAETSNLQFTLPAEQEYYKVLIRVKDAKGQREVYNEIHRGGDTVFIGVNYYGSGTAEILLNGQSYKTVTL